MLRLGSGTNTKDKADPRACPCLRTENQAESETTSSEASTSSTMTASNRGLNPENSSSTWVGTVCVYLLFLFHLFPRPAVVLKQQPTDLQYQ